MRLMEKRRVVGHTALLIGLILTPLAVWFGWANRYVVFLYEHMGAGPFHPTTVGRYWMASLVASGGSAIAYAAYCWLRGRLATWRGARWSLPSWWRIWLLGAVPLAGGVVAITTGLGAPKLPLSLALACAGTALVGLAGAAMPGALAAESPSELAWLAADALGPAALLLLLRAASPEVRLLLGFRKALAVVGASLFCALAWAFLMTALRRWRRRPRPTALRLYAAALVEAYLLGSAVHYVFSDLGGPYYITAAGNFFSSDLLWQAGILLVVWGMVWGVTRRQE